MSKLSRLSSLRKDKSDDPLAPETGPVFSVRFVIALVLILGGIAWLAYYYVGVRPADGWIDGLPVKDQEGETGGGAEDSAGRRPDRPLGGSVSFAPGVGPRDYTAPDSSEDDFDEDDEGHFVPPEPPPLPTADTTARFAWLGVLGGPVLLLLAVVLGWDMTWWLATAGVGGFLGGFVTLVTRMRTDDEEDDDPGRGAVV